jgi:ribosomal protein S18 acetylase RimI-like enzyme
MPATTAPGFSITRATQDDAEAILRCVRAAFEPYRTEYTRAAYEDTVMTGETVRRRIETMIVLVARDAAGLVLGTVGGLVSGDEGHIRGMAVLPSSQGRGVADRLLATIEGALKAAGCSFVTLDTTDPLCRAIRFYERNGYTRSGVVSDFFGMRLHQHRKPLNSN